MQISFQSQISIENLFPIGNLHCKILAETSLKHPPTRGCNPLTPTRPAHSAKSSILTRLSHHFGSKITEKLFRRVPGPSLAAAPHFFTHLGASKNVKMSKTELLKRVQDYSLKSSWCELWPLPRSPLGPKKKLNALSWRAHGPSGREKHPPEKLSTPPPKPHLKKHSFLKIIKKRNK